MKNIELLYPEYCNIYGESYSIEYLSRCSSIFFISCPPFH